MTIPIHSQVIDSFRNGDRRVAIVTDNGSIPVIAKDGTSIDLPYRPGDALLADAADRVICGPVGIIGAVDLAERILDGNQRAITDPLAIYVLATALVAFHVPAEPAPNAPATAAEQQLSGAVA